MDKVKFGRALGKGARGVGKSLWEAAEAAAAPDPKAANSEPRTENTEQRGRDGSAAAGPASTLTEVVDKAMKAHRVVNDAKRQVRNAALGVAKESGKGMLAPVKEFSSVVWLQVTGTFFAVITVFLLQGAVRGWNAAAGNWNSPEGHKFALYALVCLLFAYFTVSSFVRASRRGRRQ